MQGISAEALLSLRADMLRFAQLQLRNTETAEDLVQESIEAALRKSSSFAGQSTLKTWVFAILRNRIIDHLRQMDPTPRLMREPITRAFSASSRRVRPLYRRREFA